ncbi:MAG: hypothetical protein GY851_04895 [bacterium]|nr:hypothetical protein [bacterium]
MHTIRRLAAILSCLAAGASFAAEPESNPLREFFPYGVYALGNNPEGIGAANQDELRESMDRVCADLVAHNMNCVWPNNLRRENLPLWLEAGEKHGVRVVPQGGGPPTLVKPTWFKDRDEVLGKAGPAYKALAETYRDHPALLAWSATEENQPVEWFYEALADLTGQMAEWDPNHPMIAIDYKAPAAWMNARIVKPKALCRDLYPFFDDGMNGPYAPTGFRSLLTRECRHFREAAATCDAVFWIMGQGMSMTRHGEGGVQPAWRYPTPEEIRWQVWTSLQEGAKGFFFFIYEWKRGDPAPGMRGEYGEGLRNRHGEETPQFKMAAEVGRQIKPLTPVLLTLKVAPLDQEVVYWENTPVTGQTFVQRDTGRRFLIVVNHDCVNTQPVGIELGYSPKMLGKDDRVFNLRTGRSYDYFSFKVETLLPGGGTLLFVGTEDEWKQLKEEQAGS